ncbi:hypothetical protein GV828_05670 [Flavobacterium sp. NST-5]|uniref:DUF4199 domain-containing protein n=1 Tax=Flavobacterium ichthyis TaxID=2698827 RepID=A0ABW9Z731_9FLAO|nr:hypothetical protein [Flavobacterium ichthyis]NBL64686.1 hypothetical protein [Flavobacterium ichthyis]
MKINRLIINGIIIFIGLALYFLLIEALGLKDQVYLRLLNFIFVIYGVNRTIKSNYLDGIHGYLTNLFAGFFTAMVSVILGLIAFMIFVEIKGGDVYLATFAKAYLIPVTDASSPPGMYQFAFMLLLEGTAASAIIAFAMMQYWKDKVEKINEVD